MKRAHLPIETLPAWVKLNGIGVQSVVFSTFPATASSNGENVDNTNKGSAIVATEDRVGGESALGAVDTGVLLTVPADLILSYETVHGYAKSDGRLREVLEAVGDFGRTPRGAILIFLLMQITHSSPDLTGEGSHSVGVSSPWTEYIKYMPAEVPLPTFYSDAEMELLRGTSLRLAVHAKLAALEKEFARLREATRGIGWCRKLWWGTGEGEGEGDVDDDAQQEGQEDTAGRVTLEDWKYVDALYRSRMVDLPTSGHAMVPCIDMANHSSEETVKALYDEDAEGNVMLQLRYGNAVQAGEEVTISYGDEKSASEMIFSYGFLDRDTTDARQIFLDLDIPDDDPLKVVKKAFCKVPPGIRVYTSPAADQVAWESSIIWWACVNEEDGLDFTVLQTTDGGRELKALWKGVDVRDSDHLKELLMADPHWDIIQLRAVVLILERLETQAWVLRETGLMVSEIDENEDMRAMFRPDVYGMIKRLRMLEMKLLGRAIEGLEKQRDELMASPSVSQYLGQQQSAEVEEDFS
ncbi:SET domain-containing protein [Aspergillus saccharolyticus JOP 1030-1]|uniref:SET domain-containing protein n=1 Tax=Aspergillus saccharolyticus JOP 1030-1 TaxID=1450539 RepID=A0A318ZJ70_9EURO|nr:SET domain-containing protein [Aspergillus saccharolyticus JOP 1030-1]PYH46404.1 SET domain-containing protein [Aspergillus saccharolyticus JOP 1030-1]